MSRIYVSKNEPGKINVYYYDAKTTRMIRWADESGKHRIVDLSAEDILYVSEEIKYPIELFYQRLCEWLAVITVTQVIYNVKLSLNQIKEAIHEINLEFERAQDAADKLVKEVEKLSGETPLEVRLATEKMRDKDGRVYKATLKLLTNFAKVSEIVPEEESTDHPKLFIAHKDPEILVKWHQKAHEYIPKYIIKVTRGHHYMGFEDQLVATFPKHTPKDLDGALNIFAEYNFGFGAVHGFTFTFTN